MASLALNDEQVIQLVEQLSPEGKRRVMGKLNAERDAWWEQVASQGEQDMRRLARKRGADWDAMSDAQREAFVDELLHERL